MTALRSALAGLALDGTIHRPGDPDYDIHRTAWNRLFEHRAAAIVRAASAADVVRVVRLAAEQRLRVAVQTTGHGVVSPAAEQTILLLLDRLTHVTIDPGSRVATIGGGATWRPVLDGAQDHGLAPLLGSAPHVGVVGNTLGGGFGWLAVMPFRDVATISNDPVDPLPATTSGRWLARADHSTIDAMRDALLDGAQPSPVLFTELRHSGGAIARENPHASFAARAGQFMLEAVALTPTLESEQDAEDRYTVMWNKLADQIAPLGGYLNFVAGDERIRQLHNAFDQDALGRLAAIKKATDPDNLFAHGLRLAG